MVARCKPLTKDHLLLKTAFAGTKGWSLVTGSTVRTNHSIERNYGEVQKEELKPTYRYQVKKGKKMYSSGVNRRNTCMKQNHWGRQIDYLDRASREKNPRADGRSDEGKNRVYNPSGNTLYLVMEAWHNDYIVCTSADLYKAKSRCT